MSSPDTASRPKSSTTTTATNSPNTNTAGSSSSPPRRRGGPGGPVPVTRPSPGNNSLNIDLSGLRIDNDTESVASTETTQTTNTTGTGSSRRRRRRKNKQNALARTEGGSGLSGLPPIPKNNTKSGGGKGNAKLKIGLDLNLDLELKAKIGGDLTLSMVLEEKPKPRTGIEIPAPREGGEVRTELFYMRVGTLRLRRRWVDPDAVLRGSIFLTALSASALVGIGFLAGWFASRAADGRGLLTGCAPPSAVSWGSGYAYGFGLEGVVGVSGGGGGGGGSPLSSWLVGGDGDWCEDDGGGGGGAEVSTADLEDRGLRNLSSSSLY